MTGTHVEENTTFSLTPAIMSVREVAEILTEQANSGNPRLDDLDRDTLLRTATELMGVQAIITRGVELMNILAGDEGDIAAGLAVFPMIIVHQKPTEEDDV